MHNLVINHLFIDIIVLTSSVSVSLSQASSLMPYQTSTGWSTVRWVVSTDVTLTFVRPMAGLCLVGRSPNFERVLWSLFKTPLAGVLHHFGSTATSEPLQPAGHRYLSWHHRWYLRYRAVTSQDLHHDVLLKMARIIASRCTLQLHLRGDTWNRPSKYLWISSWKL